MGGEIAILLNHGFDGARHVGILRTVSKRVRMVRRSLLYTIYFVFELVTAIRVNRLIIIFLLGELPLLLTCFLTNQVQHGLINFVTLDFIKQFVFAQELMDFLGSHLDFLYLDFV